jgi:hypothetical protein
MSKLVGNSDTGGSVSTGFSVGAEEVAMGLSVVIDVGF